MNLFFLKSNISYERKKERREKERKKIKQNKTFQTKVVNLDLFWLYPVFPSLVDKDINLIALAGAEGWKIVTEWES